MSALDRLRVTWDTAVSHFLQGRTDLPSPLRRWKQAHLDEIDDSGIPEPWMGPLEHPRAGFLALQPGGVTPEMQTRDGIFADEIRQLGSYSRWAASWPFLRDPWEARVGRNRFHRANLRFMRRWFDAPDLDASAMVTFQLLPWHSRGRAGRADVDPGLLHDFVWAPLAELDPMMTFAFGSAWFDVLDQQPRFGLVDQLGEGGRDYGSRAAGRSVRVYRGNDGLMVVAEKHMGSSLPPSQEETELLRGALADAGHWNP